MTTTATRVRIVDALATGTGPLLDAAYYVHDEYGSGYHLSRLDDGSSSAGTFEVSCPDGGRFLVLAGNGRAARLCDFARIGECHQTMTRYLGRSTMRGNEAVWLDYICDEHAEEMAR